MRAVSLLGKEGGTIANKEDNCKEGSDLTREEGSNLTRDDFSPKRLPKAMPSYIIDVPVEPISGVRRDQYTGYEGINIRGKRVSISG